jgi:putative ABC transport system permease protein
MLQDIRYAFRALRKNPGFTAVAVITLACGIGANTAIFTLVNALLLRPLAVESPSQLFTVYTTDPKNPGDLGVSYPNYEEYRDKNEVFSGLLASSFTGVTLGTTGEPEQLAAELVSGNFFRVLGVSPLIGRVFRAEEDGAPDAHPVAVLSHALWTRRFGARREVLGETINLNGHPYTVIGVMRPDFHGTNIFGPALWAPLAMHRQLYFKPELFRERRFLWLNVVGRLKPGMSPAHAQAGIETIAAQLRQAYQRDNEGRSAKVSPVTAGLFGPADRGLVQRAGWILMIVVGMVLLIACGNVANLLLVRAASRRREIAIRLSMGAGRLRLVLQLLTESLMLAILGGALGLLLGFWVRDLLWSMRPPLFRNVDFTMTLDYRVLLFTIGISLATGLLFGLAPALETARADLINELRERAAQSGGGRFHLRNILVTAQVALSTVALIAAGLFLRSLENARNIDTGFDSAHLALLTVNPGGQGYTPARAQEFYKQVTERMRATPGIGGAAMTNVMPLGGNAFQRSMFPEGFEVTPGGRGILAISNIVTPRYFETMRIPLLAGRDFRESDREGSTPVAIINEATAKRFWPGQNAVGKRFRFFTDTFTTEVIGVVKNTKFFTLGEEPRMCAYSPVLQNYAPMMDLLVRTPGDPAAILGTMRREVQEFDGRLLLTNVETVSELLNNTLWAPRMAAELLGAFGLLALGLASIGIYGVMAYTVTQRTREIGIRIALGAARGSVLGMVVRQGMSLVIAGVVLGLGGAVAVTRFASAVMFGVDPTEPATFAAVTALLLLTALLACLIPSRRAARVDPVVALRYE